MESCDGLGSAEQQLIRESWREVSGSPLEHGLVLFTSNIHSVNNNLEEEKKTLLVESRDERCAHFGTHTDTKRSVCVLQELKYDIPRGVCFWLFDLEPDLLPLFQYNCKKFSSPQECLSSPEFLEHIRKVMLVIDAAVTHLENLHCLEEYLGNLGKKHQAVGVKVESFSAVGESLLYMLEKCHGPAFNVNVRKAWTKLYSIVVKAMSSGWAVSRTVE